MKWKYNRHNEMYLGSALAPEAKVYGCYQAPRKSRFRWTTVVGADVVAVSVDIKTAQALARAVLRGAA